MSSKVRIGLAGLGTVGATVAERLFQGAVPRAELVAVSARDAKKDRGVDLSGVDFVATPLDLVGHDKVDIVVELFPLFPQLTKNLAQSRGRDLM